MKAAREVRARIRRHCRQGSASYKLDKCGVAVVLSMGAQYLECISS